LTRAAIVLGLATILSFAFASKIIDLLAQPVGGIEDLVAIDPTEPIGTFMRVSLMSGFAIALPYIVLELWLFIAPGLSRESRLFGLEAIPIVVLFFLGGVAFAYFIMLPVAIEFLIEFGGIPQLSHQHIYSICDQCHVCSGCCLSISIGHLCSCSDGDHTGPGFERALAIGDHYHGRTGGCHYSYG
jgi:Sec-independent protein secretion pathway component TatC